MRHWLSLGERLLFDDGTTAELVELAVLPTPCVAVFLVQAPSASPRRLVVPVGCALPVTAEGWVRYLYPSSKPNQSAGRFFVKGGRREEVPHGRS